MNDLFEEDGDDDRDDAASAPKTAIRRNGFMCPSCECRDTRVLWTKNLANGGTRRRRQCRHCGREFTTTETPGVE